LEECTHLDQIKEVTPNSEGCAECIAKGDTWIHLRMCRTCGHVGCCDESDNRHARQHFRETNHPIINSLEPGEEWSWCFIDEVIVGLEPPPSEQAGGFLKLLKWVLRSG